MIYYGKTRKLGGRGVLQGGGSQESQGGGDCRSCMLELVCAFKASVMGASQKIKALLYWSWGGGYGMSKQVISLSWAATRNLHFYTFLFILLISFISIFGIIYEYLITNVIECMKKLSCCPAEKDNDSRILVWW